MSDAVIKVENLSKKYVIGHQRQEGYQTLRDTLAAQVKGVGRKLFHPFRSAVGGLTAADETEEFYALRDVSFAIQQGDRVGIIGRNGAGKSTLLKILSRITEPTSGRITLKGRVASLLEVGTGFHPELTGRENIFLNGAILGMGRAEIRRKFDEIVAFAEVERFLDTPVKRYSSGMYVRLAFAVAAHLEPEILIVDEVLAVGDAQFQKKCLGKMEEVGKEGRTVLFVSHNMGAVRKLCARGLLLNKGELEVIDSIDKVVSQYNFSSAALGSVSFYEKDAPQLGVTRLKKVSISNSGGGAGAILSTEACVDIRIEYYIAMPKTKIGITVQVHNSDGQLLFWSLSNKDKDWHLVERPVGRYESVCVVPKNLFAEGEYSLSIGLWEGFYEKSVFARDIIRFSTCEYGLARGDYPYPVKDGLIRPILDWHTEFFGEKES